jgi:hypothetical protein
VATTDDYSAVADQQLDSIEEADPELYDAVLRVCAYIFDQPGQAQATSSAITTREGIRFVIAVPGRHPYKVFCSTDGPRIEAVFPYER